LGARLSREEVIEEVVAAGFFLIEEHDFLPREYFLVFSLAGQETTDQLRAGGDRRRPVD
jgi:hypothetical protein